MNKLVYQGGALIKAPILQPIFWGQEWQDATNHTTATDLISKLTQLMEGPYTRALTQYGITKSVSVLPAVFDNSVEPPGTITLVALSNFLKTLIAFRTVLNFLEFDQQILYFVFTLNREFQDSNDAGYHSWSALENKNFYFAWTQDPITPSVSHEIVEACTDPDGAGYLTPPGEGSIEVADICLTAPNAFGSSDGVLVESYWSDKDGRCVAPARIAKIGLLTDKLCPVPPSVGTQSTFMFSLGLDPDWIDPTNLPPLTNLKFQWKFDSSIADPATSTNLSTLTLVWKGQPATDTTVSLVITADKGITVHGKTRVHIRSEVDGQIAQRICLLRQIIDSDRTLPNHPIDPLGPDNPEFRSPEVIARLNEFAKAISREVAVITRLARSTDSGTIQDASE